MRRAYSIRLVLLLFVPYLAIMAGSGEFSPAHGDDQSTLEKIGRKIAQGPFEREGFR